MNETGTTEQKIELDIELRQSSSLEIDDLQGEAFIDQDQASLLVEEQGIGKKQKLIGSIPQHDNVPLTKETNSSFHVRHETNQNETPKVAPEDVCSTALLGSREQINAAPVETKATRKMDNESISKHLPPKPIDRITTRTQSAPTPNTVVSLPATVRSVSDAGSIGSIPSAFDSLSGQPFLTTEEQNLRVVSATPSQLAAAYSKKESGQRNFDNFSEVMPEQQRNPSLPRPPTLENLEAAFGEQPGTPQHVLHAQPSLYYQIPPISSVIALPGSTNTPTMQQQSQSTEASLSQQQPYLASPARVALSQPLLPMQPGEQVIGMVGAIPLLKIQGGGLHYVKKKKGRFNLLQETPPVPAIGFPFGQPGEATAATTPDVTTENHAHQSELKPGEYNVNSQAANIPPIPVNITVPTRSQSPLSGVSQVAPAPQTFDGKSAPTVKKKGRFIVTNVKDPNSIPGHPNPSMSMGATSRTENQQHQPQQELMNQPEAQSTQQHQGPQHLQVAPSQTNPYQHAPVVSDHTFQHVQMQPVIIQPITALQTTYENPSLHTQMSFPPHHFQEMNQAYSQIPLTQPQLDGQQQFVQAIPTIHQFGETSGQVVYSPQTQRFAPQQQLHQQQVSTTEFLNTKNGVIQNQNILLDLVSLPAHVPCPPVSSNPTQPSTPEGASACVNPPKDSSSIRAIESTVPPLPNTYSPRPPSGANIEKQVPKNATPTKKTFPLGRVGKPPQTIENVGTWSSVGLGKVLYFLDQMKMEVTDSDRCIKNLQADMKLLVRLVDFGVSLF
jgi:hypothetical protein